MQKAPERRRTPKPGGDAGVLGGRGSVLECGRPVPVSELLRQSVEVEGSLIDQIFTAARQKLVQIRSPKSMDFVQGFVGFDGCQCGVMSEQRLDFIHVELTWIPAIKNLGDEQTDVHDV